jgi:hypothetical protein
MDTYFRWEGYVIMDKELFDRVCNNIINQKQEQNGIGTLSEKTVHSILKNYYEPDHLYHEKKVSGFVADIYNENGIIEIQTRNFDKLRRKLTAFLTISPVTIVYPVPRTKWIRWVNPQTGEISPPRKSPKTGSPYSIFPELYKIKDFLMNPNLNICIVLLNLEEYRYLDGWSSDGKKGSTRCDGIPVDIIEEVNIQGIADYHRLIPNQMEEPFTTRDYKNASKLPLHHSQTALNILSYIGVVDRVGKKGKAYLYKRKLKN